MIIYLILNLINHKMYIGKSIKDDITSSRSRPYLHFRGWGSDLVFAAVQKYRIENFLVIILHKEDCTKEKLAELEMYYIQHFNTTAPNGYNINIGGLGGDNFTNLSEEEKLAWRKKNSDSHKGKTQTLEHRLNSSTAQKIAQNRSGVRERASASAKIAQNRPEVKQHTSEMSKIAKNRPEVKARQSEIMIYANHIRWHWNRGIINVDCKHCIEQVMKEHS